MFRTRMFSAVAAILAMGLGLGKDVRPVTHAPHRRGSGRYFNEDKQNHRRAHVKRLRSDPFVLAVNRLSNYDRKRWAAAGYPGLHQHNPAGPASYLNSPHRRA